MNEYIEPPVDAGTAAYDNQVLARIADAENAIEQTRLARLERRNLVRFVRAWTITGLLGGLLWFASEAGWL